MLCFIFSTIDIQREARRELSEQSDSAESATNNDHWHVYEHSGERRQQGQTELKQSGCKCRHSLGLGLDLGFGHHC